MTSFAPEVIIRHLSATVNVADKIIHSATYPPSYILAESFNIHNTK
jgi:hypothetical protein